MSLKVNKLKRNAITLVSNHQLPKYLGYLILNIKDDDDLNYIKFLMDECEHFLRVKGYYKKYQTLDNFYTDSIKNKIKEKREKGEFK